jgi:carboxypeptidase Taq
MQSLLGIDTRGDYRNGCMQDVHWSAGLFGYFPCYTLGALFAAQWFAAMRAAHARSRRAHRRGRLDGVFDWLRDNVWHRRACCRPASW